MSADAHDIKSEIKKYKMVFGALLVLTVVTVLASNIPTGVTFGIIIAMVIATIKGSLVCCNFMHLLSEKRSVYFVLILAALFVAAMLILFCISHFNLPEGAQYVS